MLSIVHIYAWQALIRPPIPGMTAPVVPDVNLQALSCRNAVVTLPVLITTETQISSCSVSVTELTRDKACIPAENISYKLIGSTEVAGHGAISDPVYDADIFTVNNSQTLLIIIKVPSNIPAGIYQGNLNVCIDNKVVATKNLLIEVADITLPTLGTGEFCLNAYIDPFKVSTAHNIPLWSDAFYNCLAKYADGLVSLGQRIIPIGRFIASLAASDNAADHEAVKKLLKTYNDAGLNESVYVYGIGTQDSSSPDFNKSWMECVKSLVNLLHEAGLNHHVFIAVSDRTPERARVIADIIRHDMPHVGVLHFRSAGVVPEFQSEIVSRALTFDDRGVVEDESDNTIDEMASVLSGEMNIDDAMNASEIAYSHIEGLPDHPNTFIHSPLVESRMLPLLAAQTASDGLCIRSYADWPEIKTGQQIGGKENFLVYPGVNGPVLSLRWYQLFEGIQDYELAMLAMRHITNTEEMIDFQQAISLACRHINGIEKSTGDIEIAKRLLIPIAGYRKKNAD